MNLSKSPVALISKRRNSILAAAITKSALVLLALPAPGWADAIFVSSDAILGGQQIGSVFDVGSAGFAGGANNWPDGEAPNFAIDGVSQKYLNFGETFTGILVRPAYNGGNGAVVTSMQLWTANDAPDRDPMSYQLWGTNAALDFGAPDFQMTTFTQISNGDLALPTDRNGTGTTALDNARSQTVNFANIAGYKSFLVLFPTVRNAAGANSMQIAEVQLFGTAAFASLTWTGNISNIWNINGALNWDSSGTPSTYTDTNGVTFGDTANPARTNVIVQTDGTGVKPAGVVFQNSGLNYTISGEPIISPGALVMNGTGSVTLSNANTYGSGITLNAGSLIIGAGGSVTANSLNVSNPNTGAGSAVSVTFNSLQTIGSLSGSIAAPTTGTNTATVQIAGDLTVNQTISGTFAGNITGAGGLIKMGAGILALTGVNTYTGPTTIISGTLNSAAPGDNPQGALPAGKPVTVNAGATLMFGADDGAGYYAGSVSEITVNGGTIFGGANTHSTLPKMTLTSATISAADAGNLATGVKANYILDGNVTTVAAATPTVFSAPTIILRNDPNNTSTSSPVEFIVPRGTAAIDLDIQSVIHDKSAGLIKSGNGILSLQHTSLYTGPTVIGAGKLIVGNSGALGSGPVTIADGTMLSLQAPPSLSGFAGFSINGGATVDANNVLSLTDNVGNQSRSAFTTTRIPFASGFTASFIYTAGGNRAADGMTFTIQNSSPTAIGQGGGGLGYVGIPNSASLQFNLYTGANPPQPTGTNVAAGTAGTYLPTGSVNIASGNQILVSVSYDPVAQTVTENLTDLGTNATFNMVFPGIHLPTFIGANSGFVGFTGATGGAFASQTVGSFTFGSTVPGITLPNSVEIAADATAAIELQPNANGSPAIGRINGNTVLGLDSTLNVTGGATATNAPYQLTLAGTTILSGNVFVDIANNGTGLGSVIATGPIEQLSAANLTKGGPGTLTIAAAATYAGTTTVNAGTLLVTGSLSGAATTINNSATLAGDGTLTAVTIASGGTIAPGNSAIGTLKTGALLLQGGSNLSLEIGSTTADQVKINGAGTLNGTIALGLTLNADPTDSQTFTILDGTSLLLGYGGGARFSYLGVPLNEGQEFTVSTGSFNQAFVISYTADGGQDVTLAAVPEPATCTVLLLGLGVPLAVVRRRRTA